MMAKINPAREPIDTTEMTLFFSCAGTHLTAIENKAGHEGPCNAPYMQASHVQDRNWLYSILIGNTDILSYSE